MRLILLFLLFQSSYAFSSDAQKVKTVVDNFFSSNNIIENINELYQTEAIEKIIFQLKEYGAVESNKCFVNHDSKLLIGVVCHVVQQKIKNGAAWEFILYKDNLNWVGTTISISEPINVKLCIKNITANIGLREGLEYETYKCKGMPNKQINKD